MLMKYIEAVQKKQKNKHKKLTCFYYKLYIHNFFIWDLKNSLIFPRFPLTTGTLIVIINALMLCLFTE